MKQLRLNALENDLMIYLEKHQGKQSYEAAILEFSKEELTNYTVCTEAAKHLDELGLVKVDWNGGLNGGLPYTVDTERSWKIKWR